MDLALRASSGGAATESRGRGRSSRSGKKALDKMWAFAGLPSMVDVGTPS